MHLSDHGKDMIRFFGMHLIMFLLFASLGAVVDFEDLKKIKTQPQGIIVLILFQALIIPMVLGLISCYFDLPEVVSTSLKILKFSPSGGHASIAALLACADLPIVISCIWFSTCFSILMFPVNILIYLAQGSQIDFGELYQTLGVIIAVIVCGIGENVLFSFLKYLRLRFWNICATQREPLALHGEKYTAFFGSFDDNVSLVSNGCRWKESLESDKTFPNDRRPSYFILHRNCPNNNNTECYKLSSIEVVFSCCGSRLE